MLGEEVRGKVCDIERVREISLSMLNPKHCTTHVNIDMNTKTPRGHFRLTLKFMLL